MADVQAYAKEAFPGEAEHYASQFAREMVSKGRHEGRQEEAAAMLTRLLKRRFGSLPDWVEPKVTAASLPEIEGWMDTIFDAESLDAVFK
ncbi:DUF4351 domain-containing protein [Magnetofaba australis]|uniref:DUF4351 domain-containing protein n=1 Tax=Magnetofaba australis IT-1 TaxID=1434232 RepID=A0A1Y2K5F2_9PROT|nr:DUF4351 domain-containing protein [Magnetofaba australis]OSM04783.1 hypothetical protein MAIT1_02871 [Magnetofaba australis IT-1]